MPLIVPSRSMMNRTLTRTRGTAAPGSSKLSTCRNTHSRKAPGEPPQNRGRLSALV